MRYLFGFRPALRALLAALVVASTIVASASGAAADEPPAADLRLTGAQSPTTPAARGETIDYTLQLSNAGPDDARDVTFDTAVPVGLEWVSADRDAVTWAAYLPATGERGDIRFTAAR